MKTGISHAIDNMKAFFGHIESEPRYTRYCDPLQGVRYSATQWDKMESKADVSWASQSFRVLRQVDISQVIAHKYVTISGG